MLEVDSKGKLWIDYFRERDTTEVDKDRGRLSCGLITLGNEIQLNLGNDKPKLCCGLITLGNEIQQEGKKCVWTLSCGLITLGNEIQLYLCPLLK